MEWFRKFFGRDDYSSDQEKFAALYATASWPRGMVMLAGSEKLFHDTVYVRFPEHLAPAFSGYERCEAPTESQVIGLYGDEDDLNEYIKMRR